MLEQGGFGLRSGG